MMEESVLMSDEETSDTEVIFVDNSPPPPSSTESRGKKEQPKVVTEEMRIDEQLKELGLYEEGMSMEQKQELLVVLAASRETAEQEESMRQRAIEWERQLFSDVDDISSYDAPSETDDGWKPECSKTTPTTYGRDALPVADAGKGIKTLPVNKADESYAQKVKFAEKAFKMLEVEESPKSSENQDQKPVNTPAISTDQFYSHSADLSFPVSGSSQRRSAEDSQRGKHHLSRNAYRPLSPSNSKVAVAHPMIRDPVSEMVVRDEDSSSLSPVDFHRIKFKLEKSLSSWEPCTSPVAFELTSRRISPKHKMSKEPVPFYCPENCNPKEYTDVILNSFKKYHLFLRKMQAKSKNHMQWGEPVKAGRHHLDSLDTPTPHYPVRLRNHNKRDLYLAYMDVNYSDVKNKDSVMMNIDKCPEPNPSDSNNVGRTLKSAFRPIKAPLQLVDKENDSVDISDYELHDGEPNNKLDTLPRSKSCPSPVASNSDAAVVKMDEKCKRTLLSDLSGSKKDDDPGGKENSTGFHQWSPFGPSSATMPNSDTPNFNAFSTFATSKTIPSVDSGHIKTCDTASEKTDASEMENNVLDSQFHVRKDGQKTYSSRPHYKAEKSYSVVSTSIVGPCDNSQKTLGINSPESTSQCIPQTQDKSSLQNDDDLLSQIEGGITRKRKCEVRLTRLTPSELKAASPRKRWKKQS